MTGGADGSGSNDSDEEGAELARALANALRELAVARTEDAQTLTAWAERLERVAAEPAGTPGVARLDALADLSPPSPTMRTLGIPLATVASRVLNGSLVRGVSRRVDPWRLFSRLRTVVERVPVGHADEYPRRAGRFIAWKSKYGARKHEIRVPANHLGQAVWGAARPCAPLGAETRLRLGLMSQFPLPAQLGAAFEPVTLAGLDLADESTRAAVDVVLVRLQDGGASAESSRASWLAAVLAACERACVQVLLWIDLRQVDLEACRSLQLPAALPVLTESSASREALASVGIQAHVIPGLDLSQATQPDGEPSTGDTSDPRTTLLRLRAEHAREQTLLRRLSACAGLPNVGTGARLVSTICVSHRIARVEACVETFRRQTYPHKEFIFVANSDQLSDEWLERFSTLGSELVLLRTDSGVSLGESLNRARAVARGELWTKLDDDDHYGPAYLADQVQALRRSDASVVGKGTYFTYVEGDDALYLASHVAENSFSDRFVHGGTILADRRAVEDIEFLPVRRGTDSLFLQQCKLLGHRIYSSDRFNFVYMRYQAEGHHTYDVTSRELSREHVFFQQGLDLAQIDL